MYRSKNYIPHRADTAFHLFIYASLFSHSLKAEEGAMRVSLTSGKLVTLQRPGFH